MMIVDEIMPKVKAEVRLDKDNKTLWVKTDTLDGYGRVIIEDGSNWCRVFYDGKDEPQTCDTCRFDDRYGDESICKECARSYSDNYAPIEDEPHNCPYYPCAVWDEMAFTRERSE